MERNTGTQSRAKCGAEKKNKNIEARAKKEYLNSYLESKRDLARLEEQLQEIRSNEASPSGKHTDGQPRAHRVTDLSDYHVKLEQMEQQVEEAKLKKIQRLDRVRKDIEGMKDSREKTVLTYRYIRGYPWEKIAETMRYDISWVFRVHERAVHKLAIKSE